MFGNFQMCVARSRYTLMRTVGELGPKKGRSSKLAVTLTGRNVGGHPGLYDILRPRLRLRALLQSTQKVF